MIKKNKVLVPTKAFGWLSLAFTMIGSTWISFAGENPLIWSIYICSATLGIIHNVREHNNSMLATFAFYLVMNVIALVRTLLYGW